MNIRRILISEQEKQSILGLYGVLSEQTYKIESNGTYIVQNNQKLTPSADHTVKTYPKFIPAKTIVFHDYNKNNKDIVLGNTGVVAYCDKNTFIYDDIILVENDGLLKVLKSLFCNGNVLKTWGELIGKKQEPKKEESKKIKLPNLTEKNFCNLPGDTKYEYAKIDDGTWYTRRKGQEDWIKLEISKYQKAIDLLEKDSKCGSLEQIPQTEIIPIDKLPTKPIEQIATKTPEIQLSPNQQLQQNLNTATKGLNYLQGQNNKGI